jgi:hypothetical protein
LPGLVFVFLVSIEQVTLSLLTLLFSSYLQCYTFLAFIVGMAPPGNIFNLVGAGETMLNILKVIQPQQND